MEKGLQTLFATILGAVLLVVGLLGFFSDGLVLGLFGVNLLHNLVHLVSGAIGLWVGLGAGVTASKGFNQVFGIVYGLVAVLGLFGVAFAVNLLNLNSADNWLHVVIAVASIGVGFSGRE